MYFTILAAIIIALAADASSATVANPSFDPVSILLWTVVLVASAPLPGLVLSSTLRPEELRDSFGRARVYRRVHAGAIVCQAWLLAAFAAITYAVKWPLFVDAGLGLAGWVLVEEMMRLLPFILMLLLAWMPLYRIDRALRLGHWTMREYIEYHVRQYLLFILLPFVVLVTVVDVTAQLPWAPALSQNGLDWVIAMAVMGLFYVYSPLALRYVWKTRRLEEGDLRDRLEALCRRSGTAHREILVWETLGGNIPNACVLGVIPSARYIMLTDALMETLTVEEIEAVFAHEIGHVKRRHVTYYVLFAVALSSAFVVVGSTSAFRSLQGQSVGDLLSVQGLVLMAAALAGWGLGFGFISRRMELEADLYAADLTGSADSFVNGLERIGFNSGRPRTANSWRHFSVARRIGFLLACEADPLRRARFDAGMRILRVILIALTLLSVAAAVATGMLSR